MEFAIIRFNACVSERTTLEEVDAVRARFVGNDFTHPDFFVNGVNALMYPTGVVEFPLDETFVLSYPNGMRLFLYSNRTCRAYDESDMPVVISPIMASLAEKHIVRIQATRDDRNDVLGEVEFFGDGTAKVFQYAISLKAAAP